jgi:hypothetical protein
MRLEEIGSVSKVEMGTPIALTYKVLFPSISTFETLPKATARIVKNIVES